MGNEADAEDRTMTRKVTACTIAVLALVSMGKAEPKPDKPDHAPPPHRLILDGPEQCSPVAAFLRDHPGAKMSTRHGRIRKIYGHALGHGSSAQDCADSFRLDHAQMFGVRPEDIVAGGHRAEDPDSLPITYERDRDSYRFTAFYYRQERDTVPVFRSGLILLVRNEDGFPLVLASANLYDLGAFAVDRELVAKETKSVGEQTALQRAAQLSAVAGQPQVVSMRRVIWAGINNVAVEPTLADELLIAVGIDRWLILTDAEAGAILYHEHSMYGIDIVGNAQGKATEGIGAEQCEDEVAMPLAHLLVTAGSNSAISDANGEFVIPNPGATEIEVTASLNGPWFDVINLAGENAIESVIVTPPEQAKFLFNADNTELVRAQVNAYVYANGIRDFVLEYEPNYPTLGVGGFQLSVNSMTPVVCPANGYYAPVGGGQGSILLCHSGDGYPNTAWSSVIFHEYGHHLVEGAPFAGQLQFGEGTGDAMSVLLLDSPLIFLGFLGNCAEPLRTAENDCQFDELNCSTCGAGNYECGSLLSGCVWSIRNELAATEPESYRDLLASMVISSILVHNGSHIQPDLAIDYLTIDDDNADLCDGTPHFVEISTGFAAHGMSAEDLDITAPNGLPQTMAPAGGTQVTIAVSCVTAPPQPGTGILHADVGRRYCQELWMTA